MFLCTLSITTVYINQNLEEAEIYKNGIVEKKITISFSFLITTKINNTSNWFFRPVSISSVRVSGALGSSGASSSSDASNLSKFIDSEETTLANLMERPFSEFQVCDIIKILYLCFTHYSSQIGINYVENALFF